MDPGGQERGEVDVPELPRLRRQPGAIAVVCSHPGAYPTTACRGRQGTFMMIRQDAQSRPRCRDPRGYSAPRGEGRPVLGSSRAGGTRERAPDAAYGHFNGRVGFKLRVVGSILELPRASGSECAAGKRREHVAGPKQLWGGQRVPLSPRSTVAGQGEGRTESGQLGFRPSIIGPRPAPQEREIGCPPQNPLRTDRSI